jgi:hypothetical protein
MDLVQDDHPWNDAEDLFNQAMHQRGPVFGRGPGRPWGGIVERTPCLWITWVTDACKVAEVSPDSLRVSFYGTQLEMASVELTFGTRWYWLCPHCGRRCEAVYATSTVGCRVCLRLGYLSQSHRSSSAWLWLNRLYTRSWPFSKRYFPDDEAGRVVRELGKKVREDILELVTNVRIEAVGDEELVDEPQP